MALKFSTREASGLLTKTMPGHFFIMLTFWIVKHSLTNFERKKLIYTLLLITLSNGWKRKKNWYRFVEILHKIINQVKKCQTNKT